MKIVLSPGSFKGSLSAYRAVSAMKEGIRIAGVEAEIVEKPIADGGDDTLEVLSGQITGRTITKAVPGPYADIVDAKYFLSNTGTAYIELAQASGLVLLGPPLRNPMLTSTYGTGLLIRDALDGGAKKICLTLGGSATNDGGAGIARALGIRIIDHFGNEVISNCRGLLEAENIDLSDMHAGLRDLEIVIACDVKNPLCGEWGASYVYGPQKGAPPAMVEEMDGILCRYGQLLEVTSGKTLALLPGSGAAGGAALPLLAFANAKIVSGIDLVLDAIGFDAAAEGAALVLTGEGKVDVQTNFGKAINGLQMRLKPLRIPLLVFAGIIEKDTLGGVAEQLFFCINPPGQKPETSMKYAYENLRDSVGRVITKFFSPPKH